MIKMGNLTAVKTEVGCDIEGTVAGSSLLKDIPN